MKKLLYSLLLLLFFQVTSFAQDLEFKKLLLKDAPKIHELNEKYEGESSVIIEDNRIVQLQAKRHVFSNYETTHKIIRVNDDDALERFNKVYIPMSEGNSLVQLQIRTISPDGEVKNFNRQSLKKLTNVDGFRNFTIFAVEGAQKGGEIEYNYTIRRNPRSFGREYFQSDVPVVKGTFKLVIPEKFEFSTKPYNGFPKCEKFDFNCYTVTVNDIPAVTEESSSSYRSKLMRLDYKLESNAQTAMTVTWNNISHNLYNLLTHSTGNRQVSKFLKSLSVDGKSGAEILSIVEKKLKTDFLIKNSGNEEYGYVSSVLKNKVGNRLGIARTYIKCFEKIGIDFELVFTSSRFDGTLDSNYAHNMDLGEFIFYFPKYEKYIAPNSPFLRFGRAPSEFEGNKALFVPIKSGLKGKNYISTLPFTSAKLNNQGVNAVIKLNDNMDEAIVNVENFTHGFTAFMHRYYYGISDESQKNEFYKNVVSSGIDDAKYINKKVENGDIDLNMEPAVPFKAIMDYSSKSMVQKAGNDVLVSFGKVIGKQTALYDEKNRVSDVIFRQAKQYEHVIKMEIPKGYVCKGLEQLKVSNSISIDGEIVMGFVSDYKYEGNMLEVTISENYEVLELDKQYYNEYRKVINSAADFNKVVLVLEPDVHARN